MVLLEGWADCEDVLEVVSPARMSGRGCSRLLFARLAGRGDWCRLVDMKHVVVVTREKMGSPVKGFFWGFVLWKQEWMVQIKSHGAQLQS